MSYYILPKTTHHVEVNPKYSDVDMIELHFAKSSNYYYTQSHMYLIAEEKYAECVKLINPHEFIFSTVPGCKHSVSKLTTQSNIFYDLFEILIVLHVYNYTGWNPYKLSTSTSTITSLHISNNYIDSIECLKMLTDGHGVNEYIFYLQIDTKDTNLVNRRFNYIFYEADISANTRIYERSVLKSILIILNNQEYRGNAVIKLTHINSSCMIECLYILSSLYEIVHVSKPSSNNYISFDKYIVCQNFKYDNMNKSHTAHLKISYLKLLVFLSKMDDKYISSILDRKVAYLFKTKVDDLNISISQQQLDGLDQIMSICKHKNKHDKLDAIKKINIQHAVSWCEKYKIPHNKFLERSNIFLPLHVPIIPVPS